LFTRGDRDAFYHEAVFLPVGVDTAVDHVLYAGAFDRASPLDAV
jgi:hypothetical protein